MCQRKQTGDWVLFNKIIRDHGMLSDMKYIFRVKKIPKANLIVYIIPFSSSITNYLKPGSLYYLNAVILFMLRVAQKIWLIQTLNKHNLGLIKRRKCTHPSTRLL